MANEIRIVQKTRRSRPDRSTSSSRSGRPSAAANQYDTDASVAASEVSINPGKYHHVLQQFWFQTSSSEKFREIFAQSISSATAKHYDSHVKSWLNYCASGNLQPLSTSISQLTDYIAARSDSLPLSSIRMAVSAIRKFYSANLIDSLIFDSDSIKALLTGIANKPCKIPSRAHRLAMCRASLALAGHTLHLQKCRRCPCSRRLCLGPDPDARLVLPTPRGRVVRHRSL